jgi:hypothetical protein
MDYKSDCYKEYSMQIHQDEINYFLLQFDLFGQVK